MLKYFLSLIIVALLSSCTTSQHFEISSSAKTYLKKSAQSQGLQKQQYQLLAAKQLLINDNLVDAQQLLQQLNQLSLNPNITQQKLILEAQLALKQDHPKAAVRILQRVNPSLLASPEAQQAYYLTAIESNTRDNKLDQAIIARIQLSQIDIDSGLQTSPQVIWRELQTLSLDQLHNLLARYTSRTIQGWLQLALLSKQKANQTPVLFDGLNAWESQYPNHPANAVIPDDLPLQSSGQHAVQMKKVVLLLPLSGRLAKVSEAVRDGFITAFYQKKSQTKHFQIQVQDTTDQDVCTAYQQAVQNGAQFIVGPLTKNKVSELSTCSDGSVPILALNYLNKDDQTHQNFIQFGLSPIQEAQQSAQYAWQHGVSRMMTITPDNDWGQKILDAFTQVWSQLGGQVTTSYQFNVHDGYRDGIKKALHIDQSQARIQQLKSIIHTKFKSILRRRHDINGIFLLANPDQAREIHPYLNFYYAGNLPVYSISDIYRGYLSKINDRDLDGVYFNDMPWVLTNQYADLTTQIRQLWRHNFKINIRMYGIGVDAYLLISHWQRLLALPNFALRGVTGQLTLNQQHQIIRQLNWAQFRNGQYQLINPDIVKN